MAGTDFLTATAIGYGETGPVAIDTNQTEHYYRIELLSDVDQLWFSLTWVETFDSNIDCALFDATETQIKSSTGGSNYQNASFHLTEFDLVAGTYYIRLLLTGTAANQYTFWTDARINGVTQAAKPTVDLLFDSDEDSILELDPHTRTATIVEENDLGMVVTNPNMANRTMIYDDAPGIFAEDMYLPNGIELTTPYVNGREPTVRLNPPVHHKLTGTVKNEGVPMAHNVVRLYDRPTGKLVESTRSDANGNWAFKAPLHESSKYYVIAFDDFDAPVLQAVVHDYLTPVTQ